MNVAKNFLFIICIYGICWFIQSNNAFHLTDHYFYCVDPNFSDLEVSHIQGAISLWNDLGGTRFEPATDTWCDLGIVSVKDAWAHTLEHRLHDPNVLGFADRDAHTLDLFTDKVYDGDDLTYLTAHELGHFLGLEHIAMNRMAVMNHYRRYYGSKPPHLFVADVEAYCKLWNCDQVNWEDYDNVVCPFFDGGVQLDTQ